MALKLEELRAAVKEIRVEKPAFTEEDLEAEKVRLRTEIAMQQQLSDGSTRTADGLVSLNEMALQNNIGRLAELEVGGLPAILTEEQQEERVVAGLEDLYRQGKIGNRDEGSEGEEET